MKYQWSKTSSGQEALAVIQLRPLNGKRIKRVTVVLQVWQVDLACGWKWLVVYRHDKEIVYVQSISRSEESAKECAEQSIRNLAKLEQFRRLFPKHLPHCYGPVGGTMEEL